MLDRPIPEDASVEGHRARIQAAVEQYIESLKTYTDTIVKKYAPHTRWWTGTCHGINTGAKTATIDLDPFPEADGQAGTVAGWGRKTWTAGQIVGKRVRVMIDNDSKIMFVDDILS